MSAASAIEVRQLPAHTVAFKRHRGTLGSIETVVEEVRNWLLTSGYGLQGPIAVEITGEPDEAALAMHEIEVQAPTSEQATATPSDLVQIKRLPATEAVVLTQRGPLAPAALREPLALLRAWLRERGVTPGPTVRWVEISDPISTTAGERVTELHYLLPPGTLAAATTASARTPAAAPEPPPIATAAPSSEPQAAPDWNWDDEDDWDEPSGRPWPLILIALAGLMLVAYLLGHRAGSRAGRKRRRWLSW